MKQLFKGKQLTQRKLINSIIRFYLLSTPSELKDGLNWYNEAYDYSKELAKRFNISLSQAVGIVSAFSPQAGWLENKRYTVSFLISPKVQVRSMVQQLKAKHILTLNNESDIYHALSTNGTAFKTKSFFLNILNPDIITDVTIDRHAIAVCIQDTDTVSALDKSYAKLTKKQYDFFQSAYASAAKELNILPHQLQAITWLTYRRIRKLKADQNTGEFVPFTNEEF